MFKKSSFFTVFTTAYNRPYELKRLSTSLLKTIAVLLYPAGFVAGKVLLCSGVKNFAPVQMGQ